MTGAPLTPPPPLPASFVAVGPAGQDSGNKLGEVAKSLGFASVLVGLFAGIPAIVVGILAVRRVKHGQATNGKDAAIGISVGSVMTVLSLVGVVLLLSSSSSGAAAISGSQLAPQVTSTLTQNGVIATGTQCASTAHAAAGVITDCTTNIDGTTTGIRVTWNDSSGHFTLEQSALAGDATAPTGQEDTAEEAAVAKSDLENAVTAMETYATDYNGAYPTDLSQLAADGFTQTSSSIQLHPGDAQSYCLDDHTVGAAPQSFHYDSSQAGLGVQQGTCTR